MKSMMPENKGAKPPLHIAEEDWDQVPKPVRDLDTWGVYDIFGDKRPVSVETGYSTGWGDPAKWVGFERAFDYCTTHESYMPGFFFAENNRIAGIDIDSCRDPKTGFIEVWAEEIITRCDTYTEVSVSGTGVKLLGKSDNWDRGNKAVQVLEGFPVHGKHKPQIDIRFSNSFFGLTGQAIHTGLNEIESLILPLVNRINELKLAARAKRPSRRRRKRSNGASGQKSQAQILIREFNDRVQIHDVITHHGWTHVGKGAYLRPGKTGPGHSATIREGLDGVERIAFWSSESEPFETSEEGFKAIEYSAFDCWLLLRFDDDFAAAIRVWKSHLASQLTTKGQA